MAMSDEEFQRIAERILARQRRAMEEQRRFDALPLVEQRTRHALEDARRMLEQGASVKTVEDAVFDGLPENAHPLTIVRRARRLGPARSNWGTAALIAAATEGVAERQRHWARLSAARFKNERDTFAKNFTARLLRDAGLSDEDFENDES